MSSARRRGDPIVDVERREEEDLILSESESGLILRRLE